MEWSEDANPIFNFGELLTSVQMANMPKMAEPVPNFFSLAFPAYVAAMMDNSYYLSDIELLALCKCTGTNVVIFKHNVLDGSLVYLRSHIMSDALQVLTSIQVNPQQPTVRTHFERLALVSNPAGPLSALPLRRPQPCSIHGEPPIESCLECRLFEEAMNRYADSLEKSRA